MAKRERDVGPVGPVGPSGPSPGPVGPAAAVKKGLCCSFSLPRPPPLLVLTL